MSKITEIYSLGVGQSQVDFVDIDPLRDLPLFIDPHFLSFRTDAWSQDATRRIQSFFQYFITLLNSGEIEEARNIFLRLDEPNETCLGLSVGEPHGRSLNSTDIDKIFVNILRSNAVTSGLVEDLRDTMIFVSGVGKDKLSDMATSIIRDKLLDYTVSQCKIWNIPLTPNVPSGFYWNSAENRWESRHTDMLIIGSKKILLVPKGIVSYCDSYTPNEYHQHFVLNFLKNEQLALRTSLVKQRVNRRSGVVTEYVSKGDVKKHLSKGDKLDLRNFTLRHPEVFRNFKQSKSRPSKSLTNSDLGVTGIEAVATHLSSQFRVLLAGRDDAGAYESLIASTLEVLFYPDLICPHKQVEINQGRKRIDITFDNAAQAGTFFDFHRIHGLPCQYIMVECKNYSKDPANPELDQLIGRFSPNRGKVGLLVFRNTTNFQLILQRCMDAYNDRHGLIIPVQDADLLEGLENVRRGIARPMDEILRNRARSIQMGA